MFKKRGISPVIATVLLIVLTIAAASIIAGFIIPFVRNSLEGTECVKYRNYFNFEDSFGYNCYNTDFLHAITVKVNSGDADANKVKGFDLVFVKQGTGQKVSVRESDLGSCDFGGMHIFNESCSSLDIPGDTYSIITYIYNASEKYEKAEIYPVIENEKSCSMSDSVKLTLCSPPGKLN